MALDGPITYNGLTIPAIGNVTRPAGGGPGSGYRSVRFDISPIAVVQYLDKAALRDGMVAGDVYEAQRMLTLTCSVYGSTAGDLWDKVQAFAAAFNPRNAYDNDTGGTNGFLPITFRQPTALTGTWPLGYIPLQFLARPDKPVTYSDIAGMASGKVDANGFVETVSASLLCIDPRKYLQTQQTIALNLSPGLACTNRGDRSTWQTVTLTMTASGPNPLTISTKTGSVTTTVQLNLSGAVSGDSYVLDYETRLLTKNGVASNGLILSPSAFAPVGAAGATSMWVSSLSGVNSHHVVYSEAWS